MFTAYLRTAYLLFGFLFLSLGLSAQYWTPTSAEQVPRSDADREFPFAESFHLVALDAEALLSQLKKAASGPVKIRLPLPDGSRASVWAEEDPVIAPGLADRYPEIKTYRISPADDHHLRGRIGWTYQGFHASLRTPAGQVWIDPYLLQQTRFYKVYDLAENLALAPAEPFTCGLSGETFSPEEFFPELGGQDLSLQARSGDPIVTRTYRTAIACTGQYAQFHGGTTQQALAAIVVALNRINEVTETDLAIRLELIEENDAVIFLDPDTDPFDNSSTGALLSDVQEVLNQNIGPANYDVGHVVSTGPSAGGGIASLLAVCNPGTKGGGVSTRAAPVNDPFVINILAHEFGHQFGATHTMSSCQNVTPSTSYEPGGGSTIMAYAGICPPANNIVINADPYYHTASLEQIFNYMRRSGGDGCAVKTDVGNTEPELRLDYEDGFHIPISTPFELTASATDAEDDSLTYCWEQFDKEESIQTPPGQPMGNSPLFRSLLPTPSPTRVFPQLSRIVNNVSVNDEVLPPYSRDLTFRCTVRDNHPGGGAAVWDQVAFRAAEEAGPFLVQSPNTSNVVWTAGAYREVIWDVANTDQAPVNCRFVDIYLSLDGGYTYPIQLASQAPNTGSAFVTVPILETTEARVKVKASDNVFFDISNQDFTIQAPTEPGFSLRVDAPIYQDVCLPDTLELLIATDSLLGFNNPISLELTSDLPEGVEVQFTENPVAPSENSTLIVRIPNSVPTQEIGLELRAVAEDADTSLRNLTLRVISTDFSELAQLTPSDGTVGIGLTTDFNWRPSGNAQAYDFELATSPAFGPTVLESAQQLTDTTYALQGLLEENTLYYWRIRPINECGEGDWLLPFGFHTVNAICSPVKPNDVPINISSTGTPTVTSTINVTTAGEVSDVNIPRVIGRYDIVRDVQINLQSPSGTTVTLFDQNCGGTQVFNIGFDDDAPQAIQCPPDDGIVFQPIGSLADFIGEPTQGPWQLSMRVISSGGGGELEDWELEFCANITPSNPTLVRNDTLFTPPDATNGIGRDLLLAEDDDRSADELVFTVVTLPEQGELLLFGSPLKVGDTFKQSNVDGFGLAYAHGGGDNDTDRWAFTVKDGTGGWLPTQFFDIVLDPDATVSTTEPDLLQGLKVFPNPASGRVNLQLGQPLEAPLDLRLFNVQGQLLMEKRYAGQQSLYQLNVRHLSAGMYVLQLRSGQQWASRKISLIR